MPTTDGDLQGFNSVHLMENRINTYSDEIKLVWVATSGNIKHLLQIIDALDDAAEKLFQSSGKKLILTTVCDKPVDYKTKSLVIRNITWTRDIAKKEIYDAHIGIMPLINGAYTKGKGGFKLVQYISTGLPVIASNVGYNKEIVDGKCGILVEDNKDSKPWVDAIMVLSMEPMKWREFSKCAYFKWSDEFSFSDNMNRWNKLIQK